MQIADVVFDPVEFGESKSGDLSQFGTTNLPRDMRKHDKENRSYKSHVKDS